MGSGVEASGREGQKAQNENSWSPVTESGKELVKSIRRAIREASTALHAALNRAEE